MQLRYERAQGSTIDEMRENVHKTDLPKQGDTILIWVNEGDLLMLGIQDQLAAKSESLGAEFEAALADNYEDLYQK